MTKNTRGKRGDSDYKVISSYIPKDLAIRFKTICAATETNQSKAIEEMVNIWVSQKQSMLDQITQPIKAKASTQT